MTPRRDRLDALVFSLLLVSMLPIAQAEEAYGAMFVAVALAAGAWLARRFSERTILRGWVLNSLAMMAALWLIVELSARDTPRQWAGGRA